MFDWNAALLGVTNQIGNVASSVASNKSSYHYTSKLMDKQNNMNIANWNMQNEYNSPSAQMQRIQEAGLNPNLVYSSGNAGGTATSAPTVGLGNMNYQGIGNSAVETYLNASLQDAQIKNIESQTIKNSADSSLANQKTLTEVENTSYRRLEIVDKNIDIIRNRLKSEMDQIDRNYYIDKLGFWLAEKDEIVKNLAAQRDKTQAEQAFIEGPKTAYQNALTRSEGEKQKLYRAQVITEATKQALNNASAGAQKAYAQSLMKQAEYTAQLIKNAKSTKTGIDLDNRMKEIQNDWQEYCKRMNRKYGVSPDGGWYEKLIYLGFDAIEETINLPTSIWRDIKGEDLYDPFDLYGRWKK